MLEHETYILNLTEVNHSPGGQRKPEPNPKWTLLYRATEAYGLSSLFPSDWNGLIKTFLSDDHAFQKFWYFQHKGHVSEPCKETCKTTVLCFLRSGRYDELEQCDLLNGYGGNLARAARTTLCWAVWTEWLDGLSAAVKSNMTKYKIEPESSFCFLWLFNQIGLLYLFGYSVIWELLLTLYVHKPDKV